VPVAFGEEPVDEEEPEAAAVPATPSAGADGALLVAALAARLA